jgi:hypothetical protein
MKIIIQGSEVKGSIYCKIKMSRDRDIPGSIRL